MEVSRYRLRSFVWASIRATALLVVGVAAAAATTALSFHDSAPAVTAILVGVVTGLGVRDEKDSRTIRRWEAENGRLYTQGKSGISQKERLYVQDLAGAPLDAS